MLIQEIIRHKRDGAVLSDAEIAEMVAGITSGAASEGQVAAFAMAVLFRGMTPAESSALTLAMRDSGDVFDWSGLNGPVVDKHSTGGVGDNVSLILAPLVAACGGYVPMISGRGLGHTGGTMDKMEAIPGYNCEPDNELFRKVVSEVGCAIIGQTGALAPADKRLYAIRDVTSTVESIPLITASILSKKLAAGMGGLVMDVKSGNGAFMKSWDDARELASSLTNTAAVAGLKCHSLITDMNQPLASAAGNAVEVRNAIDFLTGAHRDDRLEQVVIGLAVEMLYLTELAPTREAGLDRVRAELANGKAAEVFARMVSELGGPTDLVEAPDKHLAKAKFTRAVQATESGHIRVIDTQEVGLAVVELGGGRRRADDPVNPAVGLTGLANLGIDVQAGDPLAVIHADDEAAADVAEAQVRAAYKIGGVPDAIYEIISA
jgi:thymidine phosphorylase